MRQCTARIQLPRWSWTKWECPCGSYTTVAAPPHPRAGAPPRRGLCSGSPRVTTTYQSQSGKVTSVQLPPSAYVAALAMGYHHLGISIHIERDLCTCVPRGRTPHHLGLVAPASGHLALCARNAGSPLAASCQRLGAGTEKPLPVHGVYRWPSSQDHPRAGHPTRPRGAAHHSPRGSRWGRLLAFVRDLPPSRSGPKAPKGGGGGESWGGGSPPRRASLGD